jgi:hypothetical protein
MTEVMWDDASIPMQSVDKSTRVVSIQTIDTLRNCKVTLMLTTFDKHIELTWSCYVDEIKVSMIS